MAWSDSALRGNVDRVGMRGFPPDFQTCDLPTEIHMHSITGSLRVYSIWCDYWCSEWRGRFLRRWKDSYSSLGPRYSYPIPTRPSPYSRCFARDGCMLSDVSRIAFYFPTDTGQLPCCPVTRPPPSHLLRLPPSVATTTNHPIVNITSPPPPCVEPI